MKFVLCEQKTFGYGRGAGSEVPQLSGRSAVPETVRQRFQKPCGQDGDAAQGEDIRQPQEMAQDAIGKATLVRFEMTAVGNMVDTLRTLDIRRLADRDRFMSVGNGAKQCRQINGKQKTRQYAPLFFHPASKH